MVKSKYWASLCFLVAIVLVYHGVSGESRSADSDQQASESRHHAGHARPAARMAKGERVKKVMEHKRKAAMEALLAATRVEKEDGQTIIWSEQNYRRHLAKLSPGDARELLEVLFDQKFKPVVLNPDAFWVSTLALPNGQESTQPLAKPRPVVASLRSNLSMVVAGLVSMLAKDDFRGTTKWLDSLDSLQKDPALAWIAYDHALLAGAEQSPREAWTIYQEKCPVWGQYNDLNSPPLLGSPGFSVASDHVVKTLMNTDYETARLLLSGGPASSLSSRRNMFLRYPVKGRSLERLQNDYLELSKDVDEKDRKQLEESYLMGRIHHDEQGVLGWIAEHVGDEARRERLYQQALKSQNNKVMDAMLAMHGKADYDKMMRVIANNYRTLTPQEQNKFSRSNKSIPAKKLYFLQTMIGVSSRNGISLVEQPPPENVLIIPRP